MNDCLLIVEMCYYVYLLDEKLYKKILWKKKINLRTTVRCLCSNGCFSFFLALPIMHQW
jgi:hypothetical protein